MSNIHIDLGNAPQGTPPNAAEQEQLRNAMGIPDAAVMQTGAQTISGQKTFSTAPRSTGTPDDNTSILNREQVDGRNSGKVRAALSSFNISNTTEMQTIRAVHLLPGTYHIRMSFLLVGTANTGTKHGYVFTGIGPLRFFRYRSSSMSMAQQTGGSYALGLSESQTSAWIDGVIEVTAAGDFRMQAAQNTAHADNLNIPASNCLLVIPCPESSLS